MPSITTICYLLSLLFYGMGYSKNLLIKNYPTYISASDYTFLVSLTTGYFVLAIFFAVSGSFYLFVNLRRDLL
ncbi:hypothetical protein [Desulfosporosinus meridiei]|uniref:hypothetical protein n=1 Tax=Desulfosporosinus meridiei TaxID=79209 RepID=UPI0006948B9B|nr:hypothetical protein [Desulfosporosinus meridiei]